MLETASREIRRAAEAEQRRRREGERLSALGAALDDLLFELEELNVRGEAAAPAPVRQRAAVLIAEVSGLDAQPALPEGVQQLMDRVYEAQDVVLLRRRRAGRLIVSPPR